MCFNWNKTKTAVKYYAKLEMNNVAWLLAIWVAWNVENGPYSYITFANWSLGFEIKHRMVLDCNEMRWNGMTKWVVGGSRDQIHCSHFQCCMNDQT